MKSTLCLLVIALTGCTLQVAPDGSKAVTVDAPAAVRIAKIIATK